ncbi:DNA repair protein RecN [Frigoriflavimonas asaccharolytica]|uniref:DNA repair protein RecN n=1 Tax=Frigoriflavimonas asaccharolytica TaxID=2735899 RepID=A0A8J8G8H3_9FLAO|nr:AAA family ATPase [Frigoriflavimonas asaccharolytica]NRS93373.1 DNA repair protein RecN (Recombination protein N) [Frigoriflavimonas asaccharolytica]
MLTRIFIQNFALIETLEINLQDGLQVITGETGAGKSIILGALRLILGERADLKSIADAAKKSVVEAEFSIQDNLKSFFEKNDLDFESQTIIRREILPSGKSRAFINDVPVTLENLKKLSENLIDIHSQFESSNIFQEEFQFKIIDGLSKNKSFLPEYQEVYVKYQDSKKRLIQLKKDFAEGNKEADYKNFLLNELLEANLEEMDLEDLEDQLNTQENAGVISENLSEIFARLDQDEVGMLESYADIRQKLSKVAALSHQFTELNDRLESNFLEFRDVVFTLQNLSEDMDSNPVLLQNLRNDINKIQTLFSKHQVESVADLIRIKNDLDGNQQNFLDLENQIEKETQDLIKIEKILSEKAKILSENRKKSIPIFIKKMEALLFQLGLEKANFQVELPEIEGFSKFGNESIEYFFRANTGFPLKPIQSAISGGERSRVMLAVKKLMAENSELPTLILDEIDTGVSGKIANEMGNVMQEMAKDMQLIVITHLAQVAAKGNQNYKVVKEEIEGKTRSNIISLNQKEKLQEIAQLLSGSKVTDAALQQAEELMK